MKAVLAREVRGYYCSVTGWLFAAFLLLFAGIYTMAYNLTAGYANFEYVLSAISFIYLIGVPVLTMRAMAEERRQKTDQLLYALPISLTQVVLGKYLALVTVLLLPTIVMGFYPLILSQFGQVPMGSAYVALLGFFLLGAALLALGLLISSLCESQVAAAVITLMAGLLLYFITALSSFVSSAASSSLACLMLLAGVAAVLAYRFTHSALWAGGIFLVLAGGMGVWYYLDQSAFAGLFPDMMQALGVFDRFDTFTGGILDLTGVVYFLSISGVCLFLTVQALEKRRWSA